MWNRALICSFIFICRKNKLGIGKRCQYNNTYVYFKLFVHAIVHDQAMSKSDAMGLHWMACSVCIVANITIVEICYSLVVAAVYNWIERRK